jgi:hypothetical protein
MSYELQKCNFIDTANVYTNGSSDSFLASSCDDAATADGYGHRLPKCILTRKDPAEHEFVRLPESCSTLRRRGDTNAPALWFSPPYYSWLSADFKIRPRG